MSKTERLIEEIKSLPAGEQRTLMRRTREVLHKDTNAQAEMVAFAITGKHIKVEDFDSLLEC